MLMSAVKNSGHMNLQEKMKVLRNTFLTHREMGECEAYYRLFPSLHLVGNSVGSVFVPTGFTKYRFLTKLSDEEAKSSHSELIQIQDRDGYYFEATSIYDKYLKRPKEIKYMSMMQFAKRYVAGRFKVNQFEDQSSESEVDIESNEEEELVEVDDVDNTIHADYIIHLDPKKRKPLPKQIQLEGNFNSGEISQMKLRKEPKVVRLHKFKKYSDPHEYYYAQLELYYIFRSEDERRHCEEFDSLCFSIYESNLKSIEYARSKTMPFMINVEEAIEKAEELLNEGDIEEDLDPEGAQDNAECEVEGVDDCENFVAFDYDKHPKDKSTIKSSLFKRVEVDTENLHQKTRNLDDDQMFVITKVINYCKQYARARADETTVPKPLLLKVVGSAGTGKSHIINLTAQWTEVLLRKEGDDLDQPYCIKMCFTGAAASNIAGQTLHSGLKIGWGSKFEPLNGQKRETLRNAVQNVRVGKNSYLDSKL